jgi:hypothetical protein
MRPMRRQAGLITLLLALIVFTPVVLTATAEVWTDSLYDAESDGDVELTKSTQGVVGNTPIPAVGPILYVVRVVLVTAVGDPPRITLSARPSRAPPAR